MTDTLSRRTDDDPARRELHAWLNHLDSRVSGLEQTVGVIGLEQKHMTQLFASRLEGLEKSTMLCLAEQRATNLAIQNMASEAVQTPAGRSLVARLDSCDRRIDAVRTDCEDIDRRVGTFETGLGLIRWVGWGGLSTGVIALIWVWARSIGIDLSR